jgi:DNA-directed RNA polymerase subunit RPC12/RpoP
MSEGIECPYCGHEYQYDGDYGFEQDESWEEECPKCEKTFMLTGWYVAEFRSDKADCLNGGEHDMQPVKAFPKFWPNWVRCSMCGKEIKGEIDQKEVARLST